ncbi:MAG: hypothetical protein KDB23_32970, partial [Planctomycetales bacterium]|nr:hypothetical protein [Planctomycetales bacterium]
MSGLTIDAGGGGNGGTFDAAYFSAADATTALVDGKVSTGVDGGQITGLGIPGAISYNAPSTGGLSLVIGLSDYNDQFTVQSAEEPVQVYVAAGAGDDSLRVGNDSNSLTEISGIVGFFGGDGTDTLNVYGDAAAPTTDATTATASATLDPHDTVLIDDQFAETSLRGAVFEYVGESPVTITDWSAEDFLQDPAKWRTVYVVGQMTAIGITGMGMGTNPLRAIHNDVFGTSYDRDLTPDDNLPARYPGSIYFGVKNGDNFSGMAEVINVQLGSQGDRFLIDSVLPGATANILGGAGDDEIVVGSTVSGLYPSDLRRADFVHGTLRLDGQRGHDLLLVDDSGDNTVNTGT